MPRYTSKTRKKYGTVTVGGRKKFPIGDKAHARNALARLNQAKPPLTPAQKATVKAKAYRMLGKRKPRRK